MNPDPELLTMPSVFETDSLESRFLPESKGASE